MKVDDQEVYDGWANYADAYLLAARTLAQNIPKDTGKALHYQIGPLSQTLGLASELCLKAALIKCGHSTKDLKASANGHNLENLYKELQAEWGEKLIEIECNVALQIAEKGTMIPKWFSDFAVEQERKPEEYFFVGTQVAALSRNYFEDQNDGDRFRTRYFAKSRKFTCYDADVVYFGMLAIRMACRSASPDCSA